MLKKIGIVAIVIIGLIILGVLLFAKDIDVKLSESQVQAVIDQKISDGPIRSRGIELTLNSAKVDFKADDSAAIAVDFTADGFGAAGNIRGDFTTGIRYDEPEIFLDNIRPVQMDLIANPETESKFQDVKNVASDFLKRQKKEMLSDEAKQSLENIVGENSEIIKEFAISTTYKFFETLPLYDLNDAGVKGSIASLALKKVQFTETEAIITLSPVQALIKILSFCGLVIFTIWYLFGFYIPGRRQAE